MAHLHIIRVAYRAARTTAVLLSLVAPGLITGCAAMDDPQSGRVADSNGNLVPDTSSQMPTITVVPYGYW